MHSNETNIQQQGENKGLKNAQKKTRKPPSSWNISTLKPDHRSDTSPSKVISSHIGS
jgi:hypothetical protein